MQKQVVELSKVRWQFRLQPPEVLGVALAHRLPLRFGTAGRGRVRRTVAVEQFRREELHFFLLALRRSVT
jgi:hypothetical protein